MFDSLALLFVGILIGLFIALGYAAYARHGRNAEGEAPMPYPAQATSLAPKKPEVPSQETSPEKNLLWDGLTPRETEVALLIARGMSNNEAAHRLGISPRTVDSYLRNIYGKLYLRSRTELANFVNALGK